LAEGAPAGRGGRSSPSRSRSRRSFSHEAQGWCRCSGRGVATLAREQHSKGGQICPPGFPQVLLVVAALRRRKVPALATARNKALGSATPNAPIQCSLLCQFQKGSVRFELLFRSPIPSETVIIALGQHHVAGCDVVDAELDQFIGRATHRGIIGQRARCPRQGDRDTGACEHRSRSTVHDAPPWP